MRAYQRDRGVDSSPFFKQAVARDETKPKADTVWGVPFAPRISLGEGTSPRVSGFPRTLGRPQAPVKCSRQVYACDLKRAGSALRIPKKILKLAFHYPSKLPIDSHGGWPVKARSNGG